MAPQATPLSCPVPTLRLQGTVPTWGVKAPEGLPETEKGTIDAANGNTWQGIVLRWLHVELLSREMQLTNSDG